MDQHQTDSECACELCRGVVFYFELLASLLRIIVDSNLVDAYNHLVVNTDAVFKEAYHQLDTKDNGNRILH